LLEGLADNGCGKAQLEEMRWIISAEKSDIFDVLAFAAYASAPLTRAKLVISTHFNTKQQTFLDFVLSHYVQVGLEELDKRNLTQLLRLQYQDSLSDAVADLGNPEEINGMFVGFQKWLYQETA
jgi:type I restriction enzyme R subunit